MKFPLYIGDGVYVNYDGYHVWLMTGSHVNPDNKIALDPSVQVALVKVFEAIIEQPIPETAEKV